MRPTTAQKYARIRAAYNALPPMDAMRAYAHLADQFCLSDERIRKILAKKHPP
jgi:hypothetical protein